MSDDYVLLDSGNLQKLEQVGPWRLIRPALTAFWRPSLPDSEWKQADAAFVRDRSGHGQWHCRRQLPESWEAVWGGMRMKIKPTGFGHLGFFAEQYRNWEYFRRRCAGIRALNLFAYSGLGSLAMAAGGAQVCHLDAARGMVEWAGDNLKLNPEIPGSIRWIVDDVNKFINRELRRESRYGLIALDPPSFGRGSSGQLWKIEDDLGTLLRNCLALREPSAPFTLVMSCHSPGFSPLVLERLAGELTGGAGSIAAEELYIPESTGRKLPSGVCVTVELPALRSPAKER